MDKAVAIHELYKHQKDWIAEATRSQHAVRALDWIFGKPIFKSPDFIDGSGVPKPTANRILRILRDEGVLVEIQPSAGRRPAVLAFGELLNIAEGIRVF